MSAVVLSLTALECPRLTRLEDADLELLLTIRHFENAVLELFSNGKAHGTAHTCIGQEYVPVALMPCLAPQDFIFSNHRGHGHYLARSADVRGLLAEILGKDGAVCNGVGGSQHLLRDRFLSTGIQGELVPVATGVAWALKHEGIPGLAVVFIGDGTWGEGGVYEALNFAKLWSLPLLVVVENNGIALSTPVEAGLAGEIEGRVRGFEIDYVGVRSQDVNALRAQLAPAIDRLRAVPGPLVIEFHTQRVGPHSKGDDTRDRELLAELKREDWYARYREFDRARLDSVERRVCASIQQILSELELAGPSEWVPDET